MSRTVGPKLRFQILQRDNFSCQYCGARAPAAILHVDHVLPWAKGGETVARNLVSACSQCNSGKSDTADGVFSRAVMVTLYAQVVADLAAEKFSVARPVEMFSFIRRRIELAEDAIRTAGKSAAASIDDADTYGEFIALQKEAIYALSRREVIGEAASKRPELLQ